MLKFVSGNDDSDYVTIEPENPKIQPKVGAKNRLIQAVNGLVSICELEDGTFFITGVAFNGQSNIEGMNTTDHGRLRRTVCDCGRRFDRAGKPV